MMKIWTMPMMIMVVMMDLMSLPFPASATSSGHSNIERTGALLVGLKVTYPWDSQLPRGHLYR